MYQSAHPGAPWLTRHANRFLESWLKPDYVGFEWGAGCSTVWFARRVAALTSVEHDPRWYQRFQKKLRVAGLDNVMLHIHPAGSAACVSAGADVADESLDFALVDGVSSRRVACAAVILPKIRP